MINEDEETAEMINEDMETAEMINDDVETTEMINDGTEIKEIINDDAETKEIHSIQYNYCALTAMLSRSAAERDIYIFVVQKILQNYNFSPGQELSHDYHQEEEGEGEEADPQLQLWNS